jgi:hypothetical protein
MTLKTPFAGWPASSSRDYPREAGIVAYFSMEIAITPAIPAYSRAAACVSPGVGSGSGALVSVPIRHLSRFRHFESFQPSQKVRRRKSTKTTAVILRNER